MPSIIEMKYLFLIFLVLFLPLTSATKVNILVNESYSKDGRNLTLVDVSKNSALVCVNNEKAIVSKEKPKTVNDVNIDLTNIYENKIRVDIRVYCKDCKCDSSCNNIGCLNYDHNKIQEEIEKQDTESQTKIEETEIITNKSSTNTSIFVAFFILLILSTILYYLIKRR